MAIKIRITATLPYGGEHQVHKGTTHYGAQLDSRESGSPSVVINTAQGDCVALSEHDYDVLGYLCPECDRLVEDELGDTGACVPCDEDTKDESAES